ncbi:hypothetical protein [Candidatus Poriferisodalis sp.]|uniref:hypothetical protein n=1 Tax=Candidatus Poriferisodalis sp. TaxID=3101277 RepID=UPI003B0111DA
MRVHDRPFGAVVADAIEGVLACNDLDACAASTARDALWRAATGADVPFGMDAAA